MMIMLVLVLWLVSEWRAGVNLRLLVALEVFLPLERSSVRALGEVAAVHALGYPGEVHHPVTLAKPALLGAVECGRLLLDVFHVQPSLVVVVVVRWHGADR